MPDPIPPTPFPCQSLKEDREISPFLFSRHSFGVCYGFLVLAVCVGLGWLGQRVARSIQSYLASQIRHNPNASAAYRAIDHRAQVQAEALFKRLASGDAAAADSILSLSDDRTGKTQRTPATSQFLSSAINSPNAHIREAAIQAELALEGITRDEIGLNNLEGAVGDPRQRLWALWLMGALGNRGVNPDHAAKLIESFLNDANVYVRATAVDGMSMVATTEYHTMILAGRPLMSLAIIPGSFGAVFFWFTTTLP